MKSWLRMGLCGVLLCACHTRAATHDVADAEPERQDAEASAGSDGSFVTDAARTRDAEAEDAAADAGDAQGSTGDASDACTCATLGPCDVALCQDGSCQHTPAEDGSKCGDALLCVAGECRAAGCGNGYRELKPARESCDDGNREDGDGCSASCLPEAIELARADDGSTLALTPQSAMLAENLDGQLLFAWTRVTDGVGQVEIRRHAPYGAALDTEPQIVTTNIYGQAEVNVASIERAGWVVAWTGSTAFDGQDAQFVCVSADGTLGAITSAGEDNTGEQEGARVIAASQDSFVLAWTDRGPDANGKVKLRRFDATALPLGDELAPGNENDSESAVRLANASGEWVVAWLSRASVGADANLFARRYRADQALGPATPISDEPVLSASLGTESNNILLTWESLSDEGTRVLATRWPSEQVPEQPTWVREKLSPGAQPMIDGLHGSEFAIALRMDDPPGLSLIASDEQALTPEVATLRSLLASADPTSLSLARTARGLWFLWLEDRGTRLRAFLLPVD